MRAPFTTMWGRSPIVVPKLPQLPREIEMRILWRAREHDAATHIQRHWRGRDVRDWLSHPGSRTVQWNHPCYSNRCHLRHCRACLEDECHHWRVVNGLYCSRRMVHCWDQREGYITYLYWPRAR